MNHQYARRLTQAVFLADETYLLKSQNLHFSYAEICLMYILDDEQLYSQKEISQAVLIAPSTINTIIKKWEKEGLVSQIPVTGSRREKKLVPTEQGKKYFQTGLQFIYEAEEKAIQKTLEKYSDEFIDALEYYGECLRCIYGGNEDLEKTV